MEFTQLVLGEYIYTLSSNRFATFLLGQLIIIRQHWYSVICNIIFNYLKRTRAEEIGMLVSTRLTNTKKDKYNLISTLSPTYPNLTHLFKNVKQRLGDG